MLTTQQQGHALGRDAVDLALVRAASRSLNDALALSDQNGVVLAVNPAYSRLYGFPQAEVVGRSFALIFPPGEQIEAEASYRRAFQSDAPSVYLATVRRADGAQRRVESRIVFVHRHSTRVALLSVIRDITPPTTLRLSDRPAPTSLDLGSLEALYDAHARTCVGYAHAVLGDLAAAERIVEDALLVTWRAGVGQEENDSAARLLLLSVLRRSARQMLLARRRPGPTPLDAPDASQSVERWWTRLPS